MIREFEYKQTDIIIKIKKLTGSYSQRKRRKTRALRNVRAEITADEAQAIATAFGQLMALEGEAFEGDFEVSVLSVVKENEAS